MSKILRFDDRIEKYIQQQIKQLEAIGIHPVSRPMALRFIIEKNKEVMMDVRRKKKRRNEVVIKLK